MVEPFGIRSSEGLFCLWSMESNSIRATESAQGIVHCSWCYTSGPRREVKTRFPTSESGALPPCYRTGVEEPAKVPAATKERREPIGGERTNAVLRRPGGAPGPREGRFDGSRSQVDESPLFEGREDRKERVTGWTGTARPAFLLSPTP